MKAHSYNFSTGEAEVKAENLCEFKANQFYLVSSRLAKTIK